MELTIHVDTNYDDKIMNRVIAMEFMVYFNILQRNVYHKMYLNCLKTHLFNNMLCF